MSVCAKHPTRKRKDCPACQAELGITPSNIEVEKEVIQEEVIVSDVVEVEEPKEKTKAIITDKPIADNSLADIFKQKEAVAKYIIDQLAKLKEQAKRIADIRYEYQHVPLKEFTYKDIDKKAREGWRFIAIYTGEIARVSGYKTDTVVFERVRKNDEKEK